MHIYTHNHFTISLDPLDNSGDNYVTLLFLNFFLQVPFRWWHVRLIIESIYFVFPPHLTIVICTIDYFIIKCVLWNATRLQQKLSTPCNQAINLVFIVLSLSLFLKLCFQNWFISIASLIEWLASFEIIIWLKSF